MSSDALPVTMEAYVTGYRGIISRIYNGITRYDIGHGASAQEVPVPKMADNQVLVKVTFVALNPTDHKHLDLISPPRSILGCDFAGTVAAIGPSAPGDWSIGDRIAGVVHGGLYPDRGAFAQYLVADGDLAWRVPDWVPDMAAATYGVSACTAMQGLCLELGLPFPEEEAPEPRKRGTPAENTLLVYSGSTAAGLFALQLASRAGWAVVSTCSPSSWSIVDQYGAERTFDYREPKSLEQLKEAYPALTKAFDGISTNTSVSFCSEALKKEGGKVVTLLPTWTKKVEGVEVKSILMYTLLGREFGYLWPVGPRWPPVKSDREGLVRFYAALGNLAKRGELKPPPVRIVPGGWEGIGTGLTLLRQGRVSGQKLVVKIPHA